MNLNVHVHALVLDGVYAEDDTGTLRFHEAAPPTDGEMDRLLRTIDRRIYRLLVRRGALDDLEEGSAADSWREQAPVLAGIAEASVQGRRALGEKAGAAVRRCGGSAALLAVAPSGLGPCHARGNGFDLHAGVLVPPRDRARLERLCRYALRPPVAHDRIHLTPDGQVMLELRHRWADETTHLVFDPLMAPPSACWISNRLSPHPTHGTLGEHTCHILDYRMVERSDRYTGFLPICGTTTGRRAGIDRQHGADGGLCGLARDQPYQDSGGQSQTALADIAGRSSVLDWTGAARESVLEHHRAQGR